MMITTPCPNHSTRLSPIVVLLEPSSVVCQRKTNTALSFHFLKFLIIIYSLFLINLLWKEITTQDCMNLIGWFFLASHQRSDALFACYSQFISLIL